MHVILNKMEQAFVLSGANHEAQKRYRELANLYEELRERIWKIRSLTQEAISGQTEREILNTVMQLEKKLGLIEIKLSDLRKSIGGGY